MVCVDEKSCPPSNVRAWVFASPFVSKSQYSWPTRDPDWWKAGKWVTHFFSSVASNFQRCQRQVSPMQVAAQLLEDAVRGVPANEPEGDSSRDERPADPMTAEAPQAEAPKRKARRLKKKP